ncbi:MAG: hypothetical protein JKX76_15480 [Colwellia sp.]|nr:hypothetical protein [Colwellia sp.]
MRKREDWEREIMDFLIDRLEIQNGDAQGMYEARLFEVTQEWAKGSSPSEAANRIITYKEI